MDTSEKSFEAHIETVLTASGYRKRESKNYNAEHCLDVPGAEAKRKVAKSCPLKN
ncbi:MAG: hypothetical protein ABH919_03950 [bacterium]